MSPHFYFHWSLGWFLATRLEPDLFSLYSSCELELCSDRISSFSEFRAQLSPLQDGSSSVILSCRTFELELLTSRCSSLHPLFCSTNMFPVGASGVTMHVRFWSAPLMQWVQAYGESATCLFLLLHWVSLFDPLWASFLASDPSWSQGPTFLHVFFLLLLYFCV